MSKAGSLFVLCIRIPCLGSSSAEGPPGIVRALEHGLSRDRLAAQQSMLEYAICLHFSLRKEENYLREVSV